MCVNASRITSGLKIKSDLLLVAICANSLNYYFGSLQNIVNLVIVFAEFSLKQKRHAFIDDVTLL